MRIPTLLLIVSITAIVVHVVKANIFLHGIRKIGIHASLWIRKWQEGRSKYNHSMPTSIANKSIQEAKQ